MTERTTLICLIHTCQVAGVKMGEIRAEVGTCPLWVGMGVRFWSNKSGSRQSKERDLASMSMGVGLLFFFACDRANSFGMKVALASSWSWLLKIISNNVINVDKKPLSLLKPSS